MEEEGYVHAQPMWEGWNVYALGRGSWSAGLAFYMFFLDPIVRGSYLFLAGRANFAKGVTQCGNAFSK